MREKSLQQFFFKLSPIVWYAATGVWLGGLWYAGQVTIIRTFEASIARYESLIEQNKQQRSSLPALERSIVDYKEKIAHLEHEWMRTIGVGDNIFSVCVECALQVGLIPGAYQELGVVEKNRYEKKRVHLEMTGDLESIKKFMQKFGEKVAVAKFRKINLQPSPSGLRPTDQPLSAESNQHLLACDISLLQAVRAQEKTPST